MCIEEAFTQVLQRDPELLIPLVAIPLLFGGTFITIIVAVAFKSLTGLARAREFERSRRELAAYVAEGSLAPEDAERLLSVNAPGGVKSGRGGARPAGPFT